MTTLAKKRIRIACAIDNLKPHSIFVSDAETGEEIPRIYRLTLDADVHRSTIEAILFSYKTDEEDDVIRDEKGQYLTESQIALNPEIALTALAEQVSDRVMSEQELIELLADKEHASWAHWMSYLFSKCERLEDGSMHIPADFVKHWQQEIDTPYVDLPERYKQSDREQVQAIIPIIRLFAGVHTCEKSDSEAK